MAGSQTFTLRDSVFHKGDSLQLPIEYDFDKASVRPGSFPYIDSLAKLMKKYPVTIEVGNHTDSRGNDLYNLRLSQSRANNAVNCIIQRNNIEKNRLTAVGYGETHPIISDKKIRSMKTPAEREQAYQCNRRTVFTITLTGNKQMDDGIFELTNNIFSIGDSLVRDVEYGLDHGPLIESSKVFIDSLVVFLEKNKGVKLEIANYTDQRGAAAYNLDLSKARAQHVAGSLIKLNIDAARIKTKGYGETRPLIPEKQIATMKTKAEQETAYQTNRRYVFRIISN